MQQHYEDAVMWYVTCGGKRFVCPQFHIHGEQPEWGADPDFVALDLEAKCIYVIEVTASSNATMLAERLGKNAAMMAQLLRENMKNANVDFEDWKIKFRAFVRETETDAFRKVVKKHMVEGLDIEPLYIERTLEYWKWHDRWGPTTSLDP